MKKLVFRGPVLTRSGYANHAKQILFAASQKFDTNVEAIRWGETSFEPMLTPEKQFILNLISKTMQIKQAGIIPDISMQVTVPTEFQKLCPFNIGVTAGIETDRCTVEWLFKINDMNLVIVPSNFSKGVFESTKYQGPQGMVQAQVPIEVIPESIDTSIFNNIETKDLDNDIVTPFNFLVVGQWGMGNSDRKNIEQTITTFKEAFADQDYKDKVGLILKANTINASYIDEDYTVNRLKKLLANYPEFPKVYLIHGHMPDQDLARLYKDSRVKCLLSLTHGEGYGLPLIEAAACNLPVIATNWSGHLDFLNNGKWVKIPYELKESGIENNLFAKGCRWAFPNVDEAKRHMKKMYLNYSIPKEWAVELGQVIREKYSIKSIEDQYFALFDKYELLKENDSIADSIFNESADDIVS